MYLGNYYFNSTLNWSKVTVNIFSLIQKINISNKRCSFKLSTTKNPKILYQGFHKKPHNCFQH